jgi:hypothetical protein
MKKTYRIVEHVGYVGYKKKVYMVQKKSIFGFWYNYENIDSFSTGRYDSIEDAEDSIYRHAHKSCRVIKKTYNF